MLMKLIEISTETVTHYFQKEPKKAMFTNAYNNNIYNVELGCYHR